MKKQISTRISNELYNELNEIANKQDTSIYKVVEDALIIGVKYMQKKGLGVYSAIKLLVSAYNIENPDNRLFITETNQ